jgi:hypothetical protein
MVETQNVPISFEQGVNTKSDPKQILPGQMLELTNASFESLKQIKKRDGFTALPTEKQGGGFVTNGIGLGTFQNELLTLDGKKLYSYSAETDKQVDRGTYVPVSLSVEPVKQNTTQTTQATSAYDPATKLKIVTDQNTYTILDSQTGTIIVNDYDLTTLGITITNNYIQPFVLGSYFVLVVADNTTSALKLFAIPTATPTTIAGPTNIGSIYNAGAGASNARWDGTVVNNNLYIVAKVSTTQLQAWSISSTLAITAGAAWNITNNVDGAISVISDASNNLWIFYYAYTALNYQLFYTVISAITPTIVLPATSIAVVGAITSPLYNITAIVTGTTAQVFYEDVNSKRTPTVFYNDVTIGGVVGAQQTFCANNGLASKAFVYDGVTYVFVVYAAEYLNYVQTPTGNTTTQATYFLLNQNKEVVAKLAPFNAGAQYQTGWLPNISSLGGSEFLLAYLIQNSATSYYGNISFNYGANLATIDLNPATAPSKAELGKNLLISGGQAWAYDGINITEQGFHLYPQFSIYTGPSITYINGGLGPGASTATFLQVQYIAIYEWVDAQGQRHQSAPSPVLDVQLVDPATTGGVGANCNVTNGSNIITTIGANLLDDKIGRVVTAAGIPSGTYIKNIVGNTITLSQNFTGATGVLFVSSSDIQTVALTVFDLNITQKNNCLIAIYRTTVNGPSTFYRVGTLTNVKSGVSQVFSDSTPDAVLIGNEQLYTNGGEAPNDNPPAISQVAAFKNRAIYLAYEQPYAWGYSKELLPRTPAEFSSTSFFENIDQRIGRASVIKAMDDKIIIFGPKTKFVAVGSGPNAAGVNNDFAQAVPITGTTGCTNPAAVIEMPLGLIYQDDTKGIWLLDRGVQEQYIGAAVEAYNGIKITSSRLWPDRNKVIFTLETGTNLVYDYFVNQWETDPYPNPVVDAVNWQDLYCYIQADGVVQKQTPGVYEDNGAVIEINGKTGWMNLTGITGFQRVKELNILGTYKTPHTLTIKVYVDYSSTVAQTITIPVTSNPGLYQYRVHLKNQKCEAIQFEFIESQTVPGEGLSLSGFELAVGVKKGLYKLPAKRSY